MNLRRDSVKDRRECFDRCKRLDHLNRVVMDCHLCGGPIYPGAREWECDHVVPLAHGGAKTLPAHPDCHARKTATVDIPAIAKGRRQKDRIYGIKRAGGTIPGSKRSPWKKKLDGTVERR